MFARVLIAILPLAAIAACGAGIDHDSMGGGSGGADRVYYIAADPVAWNYAPDGKNEVTGEAFGDDENVFVKHSNDRIGSTYLKCIYRGYTDATFKTLAKRPVKDGYMGLLGPTIRAEVGDSIDVHFKNNCSFPASIHPHGVKYAKDSEGAPYDDGTGGKDKADDEVKPGGTHTYHWTAPERSGPGDMEGSSAMWMYHSHADEIGDVYAGLTGFLIITRKGDAKADGSPKDVDREVFSLFEVDDENSSPLLAANLARFTRGTVDTESDEFGESNLMHAINGFVYANGPMLTLKKGERVRWYLMGMGTEVDLHTPHWHGNTVDMDGMRTDVGHLLPASMQTADMMPDDVGTWLFHCHVADHIAAGMAAKYRVVA